MLLMNVSTLKRSYNIDNSCQGLKVFFLGCVHMNVKWIKVTKKTHVKFKMLSNEMPLFSVGNTYVRLNATLFASVVATPK